MNDLKEYGILLDQHRNVIITAGYDTLIGRLHFPVIPFNDWEEFIRFADMVAAFRQKYEAKIPDAFLKAEYDGEQPISRE